jgi:dihydroorotase (multifunctional complex type)
MSTRDLVIAGGTVVTATGTAAANVHVSAGRITHVGPERDGPGEIVDASGLLVLPGMVDTHVHLMDPGDTSREDFPTGTKAAAAAGVTTIIEHTHGHPVRSAQDLRAKCDHLAGRAHVDYGLAAHVWPEDVTRLHETWAAGVSFFKIFTCTTHGVPGLARDPLRRALEAIAACGGACLIHCEDETLTEQAEYLLRAAGRTDPRVLVEWRSREAEIVAIATAATLALTSGARTTIAHVSNPIAAAVAATAAVEGADLAAEACPQYFALREDEVLAHGALRKFTPPARARDDDDEAAMWSLLRAGTLTHVSTDHAPSTLQQKGEGSIWEVPFGLPGIDTTLPFLLDAAARGEIGYEDVVEVYATNPAQRYGLWPRKGGLEPGGDADLVLVDPAREWNVADADIVSKAGWSPYSGRTFRGGAVRTMLRGAWVDETGPEGVFVPGPGARE